MFFGVEHDPSIRAAHTTPDAMNLMRMFLIVVFGWDLCGGTACLRPRQRPQGTAVTCELSGN
jgi:hypothetical protein